MNFGSNHEQSNKVDKFNKLMRQQPRNQMDSINLSIIAADFNQGGGLFDDSIADVGSIVKTSAPQTTAQRLNRVAASMQNQRVDASPKIQSKDKP